MAGTLMSGSFDYADTQGLVRFGYRQLNEAAYLLVRVRNVDAALAWLRTAPVTSAVNTDALPSKALHIAFTAPGLRALGVAAPILAGFSHEFLAGMTDESRSRRLGDLDRNAPAQWAWGAGAGIPHLVVMIFAGPGRLEDTVQGVTHGAWRDTFDLVQRLDTGDLHGHEPFGFTDGISQPQLDWPQQRDPSVDPVDYSNVVALGEFLLGYRNEYGKYTDRPLLDPDSATAGLPAAEDAPEKRDLGRNGTYLVLRQMRQDVRGFWQFVALRAGGDPAAAEKLAASMVGRTLAGDPLVADRERNIPGTGSRPEQVRLNGFTFERDPTGAACPLGAHIRRANPRNSDYPGRPEGIARLLATLGFGPNGFRDDLMSSVRFHRILRRGREYGPGLTPVDALAPAPPDDPERGLHFVAINANISRQFEFLQNAWVMSTKFSGLTGESDPLLGNREPIPGCPATADFTMQSDRGPRRRVAELSQFVTLRGGAYFFLPGLAALRYLAQARNDET